MEGLEGCFKEKIEISEIVKLCQKGNNFYWGIRWIGRLSEDKKRFITHRFPGHFFIKHQGWGFNKELIDLLIKLKVEKIILIYKRKDGGETLYQTSPNKVRERGTLIKEKDFEEQYILNINEFEKK